MISELSDEKFKFNFHGMYTGGGREGCSKKLGLCTFMYLDLNFPRTSQKIRVEEITKNQYQNVKIYNVKDYVLIHQ